MKPPVPKSERKLLAQWIIPPHLTYQRFVDKTGFKLDIGESPDAFANRVSADCDIGVDTVHDITGTYLEARYGDINPAALQRLEAQVAAIN